MDARVKERWVAALRSGEYDQTTGALRNEHGYCCLGVLCDIHDKQYKCKTNWLFEEDTVGNDWNYLDTNTVLPTDVMEWAELDDTNPVVDGQPIAQLNDGGTSFARIADIIETYL